MRIVYMGTPDFAVPCLEMIINQDYELVGVVTQPDRPRGRGQKLHPPPVKVVADKKGISVYQPDKIRTPEFLDTLTGLAPDIIVVVAYGKILPQEILQLPPGGCVNVHASLLPKYRGAAPIHWAVINGEEKTGITTMYMDKGMDTGDMILNSEISIGPDDTVGDIHDRLATLGAAVLEETLKLASDGKAPRTPQDHNQATYAPMLKKEHEVINWHNSALGIKNQIRGMNPWPGTFTTLAGEVLKVWRAEVVDDAHWGYKPGTIVSSNKGQFIVQAGDGCLSLLEVQLQGGKRLVIDDFMRGKTIPQGTILGGNI